MSYDAWCLFITYIMIPIILGHTNSKIIELSVHYGNTATFVNHVHEINLTVIIDLHILSGVIKLGHAPKMHRPCLQQMEHEGNYFEPQ